MAPDAAGRIDGQPFDHLIKLLLVGDSGVGKSSLLLRFSDDTFEELSPTIGVDFKLKYLDLDGKKLKLTVWDTAGQERFRTLTSSYYRGAQGIVFVYDITRRDTFDGLSEVWRREVDMYSTVDECVKIVIGNKLDKAEESRAVSTEEGMAFARENGCLFLECSAKTKAFVKEAFEELVRGVLETPSLVEETAANGGAQRVRLRNQYRARNQSCAC
jgi:Ras-related protein Rab-18